MSAALTRPATPSDTETLVALWRALLDEHENLDERFRRADDAETRWRNDLAAWLTSATHRLVVAEWSGEVAGFAHAYRYAPPPLYAEREEVFVESLYVRRASRRGGAGRALVADIRAWAEASGAEQLRIGTLAGNAEAGAFWRAAGAVPYEIAWTLALMPKAGRVAPKGKLGF